METTIQLTLRTPKTEKTLTEAVGTKLTDVFLREGIPHPLPCGGKGTCRGCRVLPISGRLDGDVPDGDGFVRACRAVLCEDVTVLLPDTDMPRLASVGQCDAVLDLGTTTLRLALTDPETGAILTAASALNPQCLFGADVASRITACAESGISAVRGVLIGTLLHLLGNNRPGQLTVCGNPTMTAIFSGDDPAPIGVYPYTLPYKGERLLSGADVGLPCGAVRVLAAADAYLGSDAICAALDADLQTGEMLVDIGTNTELIFKTENGVFAASAPAGPAMEGAGIRHGVGGIPGAIDRVYSDGGTLRIRTVDGAPTCGIAASGLCDLAAVLLENGQISREGTMLQPSVSLGPIAVYPEDIHALLLAKAAIRAAIETLCVKAKTRPRTVVLTGGGGTHIRRESAVRIGLLPSDCDVRCVPDAALNGARTMRDDAASQRYETLLHEIVPVSLSEQDCFDACFFSNMVF